MSWIKCREIPFVGVGLLLPDLGSPLRYRAVLDTGAITTVVPGQTNGLVSCLHPELGEVTYTVVNVHTPARQIQTVHLMAVDTISCKKLGHASFSQYDVFIVSFDIGSVKYEMVKTIFMPPDSPDVLDYDIILGRDFLFAGGGSCYDSKKGRFKKSLCWTRRLL